MRNRIEARCRSWIARNKNQLTVLGAFFRPLEVVFYLERLVVFIDAEERHIQIIARKCEVIRITAKESNRKFRREYQAHIGVLFITIEIVLAALIKRDDVAPQACFFI